MSLGVAVWRILLGLALGAAMIYFFTNGIEAERAACIGDECPG